MNNHELDSLYLEYPEKQENADEKQESRTLRSEQKRITDHGRRPGGRMRGLTAVISGVIIGILLCAGILAVTSMHTTSTAAETSMDYQDKVELILNYLRVYYLDDLDEEKLGDILSKGLMENIGDKYAEYYDEEEFARMMEDSAGEYSGIGVQVAMNDDGYIEVYRVFEGSPAEEAGIYPRDLIIEAGGVRDFESLDDLVAVVRGKEGTTVDLVVLRGEEEIPFTVERRNIVTDSVYGEILQDTLGYMQIAEFNTATIEQFRNTLKDLQDQGMTAVIMDLRSNPGGDYDSVVAVCDQVLPEGPIVTVEDKRGGVLTENSDAECLDIPIVLIVDEGTASAAELFTMALKDYDMAQTVGTKTYGKGVVQSIFRLSDGSGLKFTTEKYYGPNGNCIQDTGIEPDYVIEFPDEVYEDGVITVSEDIQLQKAAELLGFELDVERLEAEQETEEIPQETEADDSDQGLGFDQAGIDVIPGQ